jgi:hypothetical protein
MNTFQPSIDSPSSSFSDWLDEAVALVQRVNARLRPGKPGKPTPSEPSLRYGRRVLTDSRCLVLAGLGNSEIAA